MNVISKDRIKATFEMIGLTSVLVVRDFRQAE